jgi:hypothetical protein
LQSEKNFLILDIWRIDGNLGVAKPYQLSVNEDIAHINIAEKPFIFVNFRDILLQPNGFPFY